MVGVMRSVLPSYSGSAASRTAFAMSRFRPHTTIGMAAMLLFGVESAAGVKLEVAMLLVMQK